MHRHHYKALTLIYFQNKGPEGFHTNFWSSDYAEQGLFYLVPNAGALRLLVPANQEDFIVEMRTGKLVTIENSVLNSRHMDVVFEDGTDKPFFVCLPRSRCLTIPKIGKWKLAVWTQSGNQLELPCNVKSTGRAR